MDAECLKSSGSNQKGGKSGQADPDMDSVGLYGPGAGGARKLNRVTSGLRIRNTDDTARVTMPSMPCDGDVRGLFPAPT